MKYIRTKDTIYEVIGENEKVLNVRSKRNPQNTYFKSKCQTDVIKSADTIEELCDEFITHDEDDYCYYRYLSDAIKWTEPECIKSFGVYGAIWTDKGLIYVAKMNDKGELELL